MINLDRRDTYLVVRWRCIEAEIAMARELIAKLEGQAGEIKDELAKRREAAESIQSDDSHINES